MAWNTLTYACGHSEEVQLYGKHTMRDQYIANAAQHNCPACRAAAATVADAAAGLPTLTGSEKQISWASQCRTKILADAKTFGEKCSGLLARIDSGDLPATATAEKIAASRAELESNLGAVKTLAAITKAGWWIDQRSSHINQIIIDLRK